MATVGSADCAWAASKPREAAAAAASTAATAKSAALPRAAGAAPPRLHPVGFTRPRPHGSL